MINRIFRHAAFKFGTWWLFWTIIGAWLLERSGLPLTTAITDAAITQLDWTIAGYVLTLILQYYRPNTKNLINLLFFSLGLAAIFTFALLPYALPPAVDLFTDYSGYDSFLENSLSVRFVISWMQLLFMAAITWIWHFVQEQKESQKIKTDTEKLAREAELSQLRQQLQPHFLFNSLNSINALIGTQPELARKMIQQLSDFLRGTVKKDDRQLVSLDDELNHLSLYLDIEKVRFGYRLNSIIDADEESRKKLLPPLLLQPIVENAIKFGLYDTVGEITVSIHAFIVDKHLQVTVRNPFDPATSQPRKGTGFGLSSISRRLYLIYFRNDLLETSSEDTVFSTTIKIPQA